MIISSLYAIYYLGSFIVGSKKDAIYLGEERISYSNSHTRFIEIVVPNLCLQIAVDSNDAVDGMTQHFTLFS